MSAVCSAFLEVVLDGMVGCRCELGRNIASDGKCPVDVEHWGGHARTGLIEQGMGFRLSHSFPFTQSLHRKPRGSISQPPGRLN